MSAVSLIEEKITSADGQPATPQPILMRVGTKFKLNCQCMEAVKLPTNLKLPMEMPYGVCATTEFKITQTESGTGLSQEDIVTAMGNPLMLQWVNVKYHHLSDWEPRTDAKLLGTPGGDFVEFINMLDTFEDTFNVRLNWWHCRGLMYKFLTRTQKMSFYYATDSKALRELGAMVDIDDLDLRQAPASDQERWRILNAMMHPETNGCRILSDMIANPSAYEVRDGLPQCAIIGFFDALWNKYRLEGRKLRIVILDTPKKAKAVVNFKTSDACAGRNMVPLMAPRTQSGDIFLYHEDAANIFRMELAKFMSTVSRVDPSSFFAQLKANGQKYLGMATNLAAAGLPVYEVVAM